MESQIQIQHVPPGSLQANPWNSNIVGPEMERRLDESVRRFGVYKPIICRELEDGTLQILGGQHRCESAVRHGMIEIPVVNLGRMTDQKAKAIGLADNGRYGEDDALRLSAILKDLNEDDVSTFLPFTEQDLAGIFASDKIALDEISLDGPDDEDAALPSLETERPTITHALLRFKVPIEDQGRVEALMQRVIKSNGFDKEDDSMIAAGMALVAICSAAKDHL